MANFDTRDEILFPSVELKQDAGYLFFIRTVPSGVVAENQYINLIAQLTSDEGPIETILEAKFFPKGRMLMFSVAIPKLSFYQEPDCSIIALPREFIRGTGNFRELEIELLYEDKETYKAENVNL